MTFEIVSPNTVQAGPVSGSAGPVTARALVTADLPSGALVNGGALGTPSSGNGSNITNVNAATLGGATFAAPGAIGGGTAAAVSATTVSASDVITVPNSYYFKIKDVAGTGGAAFFGAASNNTFATTGNDLQISVGLATQNVNIGTAAAASPWINVNSSGGTWRAGGNIIYTVTATGVAVTGALSATGLLDLSGAAAGQIKFPATQNASADANTLDDYDQYTAASAACTGAITTAAVWKLTKVGNVVTLTLPVVVGTASAAGNITFGTSIPTKYRPVTDITVMCPVQNNNAASAGMLRVTLTGVILLYPDLTNSTNFTAAHTAGTVYSFAPVISWTI
jgi:hypothetical protein